VLSTAVGYAGGTSLDPTYHDLGTHAECLQIEFDPARLGFDDLLDVFWSSHRPTRPRGSSQYRSAIFTTSADQTDRALASKAGAEARADARLHTEIAPLARFYVAEDYHQKYRMQRVPTAAAELHAIYPRVADLIQSTAAARVNAFAGGHGDRSQLDRELGELGLGTAARDELVQRWTANHHGA
jgi:methionine-S-sulfoxide reductase